MSRSPNPTRPPHRTPAGPDLVLGRPVKVFRAHDKLLVGLPHYALLLMDRPIGSAWPEGEQLYEARIWRPDGTWFTSASEGIHLGHRIRPERLPAEIMELLLQDLMKASGK